MKKNGNSGSNHSNVILATTAPVGDGGRKYNFLYLIGILAGFLAGFIAAGGNGGAGVLGALVAILIVWIIKNHICWWLLHKMRDVTYHCDTKLPYSLLIQQLQPKLLPIGMTIESGKSGNPVITYKGMIYDISYTENENTFGIWWRTSAVHAFFTTNLYIPEYRKACVAYGIIGWNIQQVLSSGNAAVQEPAAAGGNGTEEISSSAAESVPQGRVVSQETRKKSSAPKIILIVVIVIALLLFVLAMLGSTGTEGDQETSERAAAVTTVEQEEARISAAETTDAAEESAAEETTAEEDSTEETTAEEESESLEVDTSALISDLVGTWELDSLDDGNVSIEKEDFEDTFLTFEFDADGNCCVTTSEDEEPAYGTYVLKKGTVTVDPDSEEPMVMTIMTDGSMEYDDEENGLLHHYIRTSRKTDFEVPVADEFAEYADTLPGNYAVLGTYADDNVMPLSELAKAKLTDEGYAELEAWMNESLSITADETYTLLDYDGSTSSGTITVVDDTVYLDGTAKFTIVDEDTLIEQTDDGTILVLMDPDLIESATNEILGTSDTGESESQTDGVTIGGIDFYIGDTMQGDMYLVMQVDTDGTWYGYLSNEDGSEVYCGVIFLNGFDDIDCNYPEYLEEGCELYVPNCVITDIYGYDDAGIPVIAGQIYDAQVCYVMPEG